MAEPDEFFRIVDRSVDWAEEGPRLLPILRAVSSRGDDALVSFVLDIEARGDEPATTAVLSYLGDVINEVGVDRLPGAYALLKLRLSPENALIRRHGASIGLGSIMSLSAARALRSAAEQEPAGFIAESQIRSAEVIERNASGTQTPYRVTLAG